MRIYSYLLSFIVGLIKMTFNCHVKNYILRNKLNCYFVNGTIFLKYILEEGLQMKPVIRPFLSFQIIFKK